MDAKKHASADVHKNRTRFFLIGLSASLAIVIIAFEWTVRKIDSLEFRREDRTDEIIFNVPVTTLSQPESKPLIRQRSASPEYVEVDEVTRDAEDAQPLSDSDTITFIEPFVEPLPEEHIDEIHDWTEKMPEPEGGYSNFYKLLQSELRYPRKAQSTQTEGKVFVSFVVNGDGNLTDLKVVKGIGMGCDEEAVRVLSLTRWIPGRHGGRKVRVRMIQPIYFRLEQ